MNTTLRLKIYVLWFLLCACLGAFATIIPTTNAPTAVWSVAGVLGGIPTHRAVFTNFPNWGANETNNVVNVWPQISNAISRCPAQQVVLLPAGTLKIANQFRVGTKDNWTVRGQGATTILNITGNFDSQGAAIEIGNGPSWTGTTTITNDVAQGATNIMVANFSLYATGALGKLAAIDMQDSGWIKNNGSGGNGINPLVGFNGPSGQIGKGGPSANTNVQVHYCMIVGITPATRTITIDPALPYALDASRVPQISYSTSRCLTNFGFESLVLNFSNHTGTHPTRFQGVANFWLKNIECIGWDANPAIWLRHVVRPEIFGCYIHDPRAFGIDRGYGLLGDGSSAGKVLGNIIYNCTSPFLLQNGCTANVIVYNAFCFNRGAYSPGDLVHDMSGNHTPFPCYNLFEGNYLGQFQSDFYYGPSGWGTLFRNRIAGRSTATTNRFLAVTIDAYQRNYSIVGNSLGTTNAEPSSLYLALPDDTRAFATPLALTWTGYDPGSNSFSYTQSYIYRLGYPMSGSHGSTSYTNEQHDAYVHTNTLRHGNWDAYTPTNNGLVWDPNIADHGVPNSMFISSAPYFFGTNFAWPPYSGTNAPTNMVADLQSLPAGWRLLYGTNKPYAEFAVSTNYLYFGVTVFSNAIYANDTEGVYSHGFTNLTLTITNIGTANGEFQLTNSNWFIPFSGGLEPLGRARTRQLNPGETDTINVNFWVFNAANPTNVTYGTNHTYTQWFEADITTRPIYYDPAIFGYRELLSGNNPVIHCKAGLIFLEPGYETWASSFNMVLPEVVVAKDFSTNADSISTATDTTPFIPGQSGEATVLFVLTNRSIVTFTASVQATNAVRNSFMVSIDGEPDPNAVWNLTATDGSFTNQTLNLQGVGTVAVPDEPAKPWLLDAGTHYVKVYGMTAGTKISSLTAIVQPIIDGTPFEGKVGFEGGVSFE